MKLLYAEDEPTMAEAVVDILTYHNHLVDAVSDGEDALSYALSETYDGIILDPPSYGRGTNGEMWKLEDSICDLMNMCTEVLSDNPLFIVLNSYTTGLSSSVMTYLLQMTVGRKYKIRVDSQEIGLPVEQTGLAVPAGNTAVVYFD